MENLLNIKTHMKHFILFVLILSIVGIWATSFPVQSAELVDRVVAIVNEDIIRLSDLEKKFEPVVRQIESENYSPEKKEQVLSDARTQVLDEMINETLADQKIAEAGINVGQDEIDAAIERVKSMNRYADEDIDKALQMRGMDMESYREEIRKQIRRSKLVNRQVKANIVITDSDIREYYESHEDVYGGQIKYDLKNIFMAHSNYIDGENRQSVSRQMEDILKQLKDGASFSEMARTYSQGPNAEDGGDLGAFAIEDLSEELRPVIRNLEAGDFSRVIETDLGYQVFYVEKIDRSGAQPLEDVRAEIENKLYEQAVDRKFNSWIESLRQRAHIKIML